MLSQGAAAACFSICYDADDKRELAGPLLILGGVKNVSSKIGDGA